MFNSATIAHSFSRSYSLLGALFLARHALALDGLDLMVVDQIATNSPWPWGIMMMQEGPTCCCPISIKFLPPNGKDTPGLEGGGSLADYWDDSWTNAYKKAGFSDKEAADAKKDGWGDDKKLGRDEGAVHYKDEKGKLQKDPAVLFKFQVIGESKKIPAAKLKECTLTQTYDLDWKAPGKPKRRMATEVDDYSTAGADPNKNATEKSEEGKPPGCRKDLGGGKHGWVDPVSTGKSVKGITTRTFVVKYTGGNCPCEPENELTKTMVLIVDTNTKPAGVDWAEAQ